MKQSGVLLGALLAALGTSGCPLGSKDGKDAGPPNYLAVPGEGKGLLPNLIGRWFPEAEIERLDNDTMTPQAWCAREPTMILVNLNEVLVQCDSGPEIVAAIARVERTQEGGVRLVMRGQDEGPFKSLLFDQVLGPKAIITGSPCNGGERANYARFPKIEVLRRQILSGKRCAQILKQTDIEPAP